MIPVRATLMPLTRHCCVNFSNHWRLVISEEDKVFIEVLRQERVMGWKSSSKSLQTETGLCRLWSHETDTVNRTRRKPGSANKCTARISYNIDSVEQLVSSQESASGTHKTICQIAQKTGISNTTAHRIFKGQTGLKTAALSKRKAQDVTAANKFLTLFRAKHLLGKYPEQTLPFTQFSC